jgi:HAD superfamily hydrolase (TIGR01490 family)
MAIAFFDFDNTLLSVNSAWLWVRRELRLGHLSRWEALRAGYWMARYELGFVSMEAALEKVISALSGVEVAPVRARTSDFYRSELRSLYRPGARRAVEAHRAAGDRLVLLTSSSIYLAELVAEELRLDHVLCNRFEVDAHGRHTGKTIGDVCFGLGKLRHAQAFAEKEGIPLSACTFYTDSYADLSVLEAVGRPVAVNPDLRLRREALRRHWPIVDWGYPPEPMVGLPGSG